RMDISRCALAAWPTWLPGLARILVANRPGGVAGLSRFSLAPPAPGRLRLVHLVDREELLGRRRRVAGNFALAEDDRLAEQQPDLDVAHHQPEEAPIGLLGVVETQQPRLPPCFQHRLQARAGGARPVLEQERADAVLRAPRLP